MIVKLRNYITISYGNAHIGLRNYIPPVDDGSDKLSQNELGIY